MRYKKIIAVLNEFSGKWDESLGQSEFELNSFPDLNWTGVAIPPAVSRRDSAPRP